MLFFVLLLVPFSFSTGAFVFAGLLEPMAAELGVSVGTVGWLQSAFAISSAICGPLLAYATRKVSRKTMLLATLIILFLLNGLSAIAADYQNLFFLRLLAGGLGALAIPLATTFAANLAAPEKRAGAIALIYSGVAFAMVIGVPLGTLIGSQFGWQSSFLFASVIGLITTLLVVIFVPNISPPVTPRSSASVFDWTILGYLLVSFIAFASMFATVGFIAPIISAITGFSGSGIAMVQIYAGLSCLIGLPIGAKIAARKPGAGLPLLFASIFLSHLALVLALSNGWVGTFGLAVLLVSIALGPSAMFASAPVVQTRLAEFAGPSATLIFALNGSMVYLGQGLGVAAGAIGLSISGLMSAPFAGTMIAIVGLFLSLWLISARSTEPEKTS